MAVRADGERGIPMQETEGRGSQGAALDLVPHPGGPAYVRVFETLREEILRGRLAPGQHLAEAPLAERLGVSRAPVREAIRRLEQSGLVVRSMKEGLSVARPLPHQVAQLYGLRAALEGFAAHEAAEGTRAESPAAMGAVADARRVVMAEEEALEGDEDVETAVANTNAFHDAILRAARNPYLLTVMGDLEDRIVFFRNTSLRVPGSPQRYHEAHGAILEAIEAGDAALAQKRMVEHVREAAGRIQAYLEGDPGAARGR